MLVGSWNDLFDHYSMNVNLYKELSQQYFVFFIQDKYSTSTSSKACPSIGRIISSTSTAPAGKDWYALPRNTSKNNFLDYEVDPDDELSPTFPNNNSHVSKNIKKESDVHSGSVTDTNNQNGNSDPPLILKFSKK